MWFDSKAVAQKIENQRLAPATPATLRHEAEGETVGQCRNVAEVAGLQAEKQKMPETLVVAAIGAGKCRPGPIARQSGLGATVTYQLIDSLLKQGRLIQERDGTLRLTSGGDA